MFCINKNSEEFKSLVEEVGFRDAVAYYLAKGYIIEDTEFTPTAETSTGIKPGVEELFNSNPELANEVYEALGFKKKQYVSKLKEISERRKLATKEDLQKSQLIKDIRVDKTQPKDIKPNEADKNLASIMLYGHRYSDLSNLDYIDDNLSTITNPAEMQLEAETLAYRILNDLLFDIKEINEFYEEIKENPEYAATLTTNENSVKEFFENDIFEQVEKEKFQITPQQKQQAQQLYSQYLDTIFPDSQVKDIAYHGSNIDFSKQTFKRDWIGNFKGVYFYFKNSSLFGKQSYKFDNPSLINIVKPETSYDKLQELIANTEKFAKTLWNLETNATQSKTGKVYHGSYLMVESVDDTIKYYEKVNDNWVEINNETAENLIAKNSVNGDGILIDNNQAVVFEPEQIHILGSKQDIEGFKEFVGGNKVIISPPGLPSLDITDINSCGI